MIGLLVAIPILIPILLVIIFFLLISLGWYFGEPPRGSTTFINAAQERRAIWPNMDGYLLSIADDLDHRKWLIPSKDEEERINAFFRDALPGTKWFQKLVWRTLGVRFISWFWPRVYVFPFDIRSVKIIKERTEVGEDAPLRSRVADALTEEGKKRSTTVDNLRFIVPRPVYVEGLELPGDNAKVNIALLPIYRQVIPSLPVYDLKGDFFTPLDAAIEAAMVDFTSRHRVAVYKEEGEKKGQFAHDTYEVPREGQRAPSGESPDEYKKKYEPAPLTYSLWLKLSKGGSDSPIEKAFRHLNISPAYRHELKKVIDGLQGVEKVEKQKLLDYIDSEKWVRETEIEDSKLKEMIPSGIVPRFGFALVSFRLVEWEAHSSTVALAEAVLAKETQFHTAEGVRQKAFGERDAIDAVREAEVRRYGGLIEAQTNLNVNPNVAAETLRTAERTRNIAGIKSKVTTYVEGGGASTSIMVPASPPTPPTNDQQGS